MRYLLAHDPGTPGDQANLLNESGKLRASQPVE
jgi:hypothetical protein